MARDIIEAVLKNEFVLEDRIKFARNQTREVINPVITPEKLSEALMQSLTWAQEFGLKEDQTNMLAQRHGFEGLDILKEGEDAGLSQPWEMEALFACRYTMCFHLKDFMLRRVPLFLALKDHGFSFLEGITRVMAAELSWNKDKAEEELRLYKDHLKFEMGWRA
jgi:glycerol-3-phosphate dehydrogenase